MGHHAFDSDFHISLDAAYAIEIFHNFSLMHDDIMDNAPLRRGNQTVHEKYDHNTAILSGDVMLIHAYDLLSKYDKVLSPILKVFNKMAIELCEGQRMDMDFEKSEHVSITDYLQMIEFKTSVLLGAALEIGAIIGGCDAGQAHHLYEYGKNIGIAFQIQDDVLDSFGDASQVGKKSGGDIIQNKKTYLYIKARELADVKQNEILNKYYSIGSYNENDKVNEIKKIFINTGAVEYANQVKYAYKDLALSHLMQIDLEDKNKQELIQLAEYLIERKL